jgi:hypothetical protein
MGYKTHRLEFPELFEGAFVEIIDRQAMSWGQKKALLQLARQADEVLPSEEEEATEGDKEAEVQRALERLDELLVQRTETFALSFIVRHNIPPIDDPDGAPLSVPLRPEDLNRIPSVILERVAKELAPNPPAPEAPSSSAPESEPSSSEPTPAATQ